MSKSYAVFILSHGRPYDQKTLRVLLENNYKGDWFIICDDLDTTLEDYKKEYGDHVIVFDKQEYIAKVDTVDNFKKETSPVYARNACFDIAREKGYKNFIMLDDDIKNIQFRYVKDGKLLAENVSNISYLFDSIIDFQNEADINTVSLGVHFDYIGGITPVFLDGFKREGFSCFFLKTDGEQNFIGTIAEDLNHSYLTQQAGGVHLTFVRVQLNLMTVGDTEGGLYNLYKSYEESKKYMEVMYMLIPRPDSVFLALSKKKLIRRRNLATMYPVIIREEWKK